MNDILERLKLQSRAMSRVANLDESLRRGVDDWLLTTVIDTVEAGAVGLTLYDVDRAARRATAMLDRLRLPRTGPDVRPASPNAAGLSVESVSIGSYVARHRARGRTEIFASRHPLLFPLLVSIAANTVSVPEVRLGAHPAVPAEGPRPIVTITIDGTVDSEIDVLDVANGRMPRPRSRGAAPADVIVTFTVPDGPPIEVRMRMP